MLVFIHLICSSNPSSLNSSGSRFADGAQRNPTGKVFMKNRETDEWLIQNNKSTREFIRKWGSVVNHDQYLKPIVDPKYDIAFVVENCALGHFEHLEPWCRCLYYGNESVGHAKLYRQQEQSKTSFILDARLVGPNLGMIAPPKLNHSVVVRFDCKELDAMSFQIIPQLQKIIADTNELGEFEYSST